MGKDRTGKFHPPKGKPSGAGKEEGLGLTKNFDPDKLEQYEEITDKYTLGANEIAPAVPVRHHNRNTEKGQDHSTSDDTSNKSRKQTPAEASPKTEVQELPGILDRTTFSELAAKTSSVCVSIFLPTHAAGVEVNEQADLIAFKNALQETEKRLAEKNTDPAHLKQLLAPAYELLRDDSFWLQMKEGLAVFISDDTFQFVKLPGAPVNEVLINNSFYVAPLVPFMVQKEYFYLLVFSKKRAKLYRADTFGMEHIEIEDIPNGIDDVVHFENKDDQKLFRSGDEKTNIATYLEEVDDTIWKTVLHDQNVPLLLAGVEYLIPIYKSVTDYNHIWETSLTGNHDFDDETILFQQARQIMMPYFNQKMEKALNDYGNKSATALTTSIIADVVPAAYYGQISHLFVREQAHVWGTFNEQDNILDLHDQKQPDSDCLIDKAVTKTLQTGGEVFILSEEKMPVAADAAAVLRYS